MPLPAAVPRGFPLPEGTRFTSVQRSGGGSTVVLGYAPRSVRSAAAFFRDKVPSAGFDLTWGDAEPGEAEAGFEGSGFVGLWRVNVIRGCDSAAVVMLAFVSKRPAADRGAGGA